MVGEIEVYSRGGQSQRAGSRRTLLKKESELNLNMRKVCVVGWGWCGYVPTTNLICNYDGFFKEERTCLMHHGQSINLKLSNLDPLSLSPLASPQQPLDPSPHPSVHSSSSSVLKRRSISQIATSNPYQSITSPEGTQTYHPLPIHPSIHPS